MGAVCEIPAQAVPGHTQLLCAGQAPGFRGLAPVLASGPGGCLEGQSTETVHHHELVLQESE
uniref:Cytokine like 1 n=1 Tax=Equus caballus TaxID=9796 RepID=A0A9L0R0K4_HORSE